MEISHWFMHFHSPFSNCSSEIEVILFNLIFQMVMLSMSSKKSVNREKYAIKTWYSLVFIYYINIYVYMYTHIYIYIYNF